MSIALRFPSNALWLISTVTIAAFLLIGALIEGLAAKPPASAKPAPSAPAAAANPGSLKERLKSIEWFRHAYVGVRNSLILVQAQLLLLFIPAAFSESLAIFCISWFGLASVRGVAQLVRAQIVQNNLR